MASFIVFMFYDWWMYIVKRIQKKGYVWIAKRFIGLKKVYYCHDCGYNFRA